MGMKENSRSRLERRQPHIITCPFRDPRKGRFLPLPATPLLHTARQGQGRDPGGDSGHMTWHWDPRGVLLGWESRGAANISRTAESPQSSHGSGNLYLPRQGPPSSTTAHGLSVGGTHTRFVGATNSWYSWPSSEGADRDMSPVTTGF